MIISYVQDGKVVEIEFDATMRMSDVLSSTVTTHPVETGTPVNDHIRQNPDSLSFDAVVTDSPLKLPRTQNLGAQQNLGGLSVSYDSITYDALRNGNRQTKTATAGVLQFDRSFTRVADVYFELKYISDNGIAVNVQTTGDGQSGPKGGIRDYENMAVLNVTTPHEVADGDSRTFSFQLQNIRIVDTKKVDAPEAKKQKKNKGEKGKKPVTDADAKLKSDLLGLGGKISDALSAFKAAL